jgi:hypothetical protein
MRPTDLEPTSEELMLLLDDQERSSLANPDLPDDEKAEIFAKLRAWRASVVEETVEDEPLPKTPEI